jgi:hypothetical protein
MRVILNVYVIVGLHIKQHHCWPRQYVKQYVRFARSELSTGLPYGQLAIFAAKTLTNFLFGTRVYKNKRKFAALCAPAT